MNDIFPKLSHKIDDKGNMTIFSYIPDHIEIKESTNGTGVYTKKIINKGEVILTGESYFIKEIPNEQIILETNRGNYYMNKYTHYNYLSGLFQVNGYINLFNHTCDFPNHWTGGNDLSIWSLVALRNYQAGDEICWNYMVINPEFHPKLQFNCNCGYINCQKFIRGRNYIVDENYKKMMEDIEKLDI